jgi:hypothetical protein
MLRSSAPLSPLPPAAYTAMSTSISSALRAGAYVKPKDAEEAEPSNAMGNPLMDPTQMEGMMDGLKKQAVMMIPNMVIMQWINTFFSGFVLSKFQIMLMEIQATDSIRTVKLPFPLTYGFKAMLQRDISTPDMDVRYVSALSWYFLNLFGLNGLFKLMLGAENG